MKRRQRNRRIAVVLSLAVVVALIVVVVYTATLAANSSLDSKDNQLVSSQDLAGLLAAGAQPYGPAPTSSMLKAVHSNTGTSWTTDGKPIVVYVGAEYCMYCALQRWAMVVALSRFGNFSGLQYMTSASNEEDLPTFTFVGSTYTSSYIVFRPYEMYDNSVSHNALQTVPSNYTAVFQQYGGGFPFLDFGNAYVVSGSLVPSTAVLQGKDWASVISSIASSDSNGIQIREAANMITALICKVTNGSPASVCDAVPIGAATSAIAGPTAGVLVTRAPPGSLLPSQQDRVIRRAAAD